MRETTLCYIFRGEDCLLLHRNKKVEDINQGKWIGVGGKIQQGETAEGCLLREVLEETGLTLTDFAYRGVVFFQSSDWSEQMHLYTATEWTGEFTPCDEGTFVWRPFTDLFTLERWAGDDVFLRLIQEDAPFFHVTLEYEGDVLRGAQVVYPKDVI